MEQMRDEPQRQVLLRFFKTGAGDYGHGDEFLGIRVPQTRQVALGAASMPLDEVHKLLHSKWHEVRLCGLLILVERFKRASGKSHTTQPSTVKERDELVSFYLSHARQANNWDLVDLSAPKIVGKWLILPTALGSKHEPDINRQHKQEVLDTLAESDNLWEQRISIVCTLEATRSGDPSWCERYAEKHLMHSHDLMHKAVGWMLREMGKHAGTDRLRDFLDKHLAHMSRTTLRYAIERMTPEERAQWLAKQPTKHTKPAKPLPSAT